MPQSAQKPEPVSILQPQTTVNPDRVKQVRHRQVTSRSDHFSLCFSGSNCPHQLNTDDASLVLYWGETTALADRLTAILYQCCQRRPASGVTTTNYFTSIQFSFIYIASVTVGVVSVGQSLTPTSHMMRKNSCCLLLIDIWAKKKEKGGRRRDQAYIIQANILITMALKIHQV